MTTGLHCNISSSFCNSKRRLEPATKSMEFCQIWAANAVWGYYKVRGGEVHGWLWLRPEACHAPQTSRGFLLGFASTRAMVPWRFAWCPRGDGGVVFGDGLSHIQGRYPHPNNDYPHSYIPYYPQFSSWPLEGGRRIRRMAAGVRQRLTRVCLVCLMTRSATPPHHPLNLPTLHGPHAHPHLH